MQPFRYIRAHNVEHAATLLQEGRARIVAGGTDLIVALRERRLETDLLIDIKGLPEIDELSYTPEDGLRIGAAVPCHRIYGNTAVSAHYPGSRACKLGWQSVQRLAGCRRHPGADRPQRSL